jgi:hypothetical protein
MGKGEFIMNKYNCDIGIHEIDDKVNFNSINNKSAKAEIFCVHCDYSAEVDHILDEYDYNRRW